MQLQSLIANINTRAGVKEYIETKDKIKPSELEKLGIRIDRFLSRELDVLNIIDLSGENADNLYYLDKLFTKMSGTILNKFVYLNQKLYSKDYLLKLNSDWSNEESDASTKLIENIISNLASDKFIKVITYQNIRELERNTNLDYSDVANIIRKTYIPSCKEIKSLSEKVSQEKISKENAELLDKILKSDLENYFKF